MFLSNLNATRRPWPAKRASSPTRSPLLALTILFSLLLLISYYYLVSSPSSSSAQTLIPAPHSCSFASPDKFLFFAPHSGFSNQLSELRNALLVAGILNRTLVVPPVLDHHAVALGSCPKFRVSSPGELRVAVWDHAVELIRSGRYISIADIIDISSLVSSSLVLAIDFRVFASRLCNLSLDGFCVNDLNGRSSLLDGLKRCGSMLSGVDGNLGNCLYAVNEDCRNTVWTYRNGHEDGALDSFQPDEQLKRKKNISYVRKRRDVYKSLGPGSEADSATVLAFGSLFSSPYKNSESYIDIHESPRDQRIQNLIEKSVFLPFAPEITSAGKRFVREKIQASFLCAQLRLLDGQFKNHWKSTFLGLKQKVESLEQSSRPVHIFVMTDLPEANWTGSYLGDLAKDMHRFKLFSLKENDDLVVNTARRIGENSNIHKRCGSSALPDVLLYIEETICSCASLGFIGTSGSTIAESIELMRKFRVCSS